MNETALLACRLFAYREDLADGKHWSFALENDSASPFDDVVVEQIDTEWGDTGTVVASELVVGTIAAGAYKIMWRDAGDCAEVRTSIRLRLTTAGAAYVIGFDLPKLYTRRDLIGEINKLGAQFAPSYVSARS